MYLQKPWPLKKEYDGIDDPDNTRLYFSIYPPDFVDLSEEEYEQYWNMFDTHAPRQIDFWLRGKQAKKGNNT